MTMQSDQQMTMQSDRQMTMLNYLHYKLERHLSASASEKRLLELIED